MTDSEIIKDLTTVIERLKAEKEALEEIYKEARRTRNRLCESLKNARAEAVTEFIAWIVQDYPELEYYLNNLAEELKEGEW